MPIPFLLMVAPVLAAAGVYALRRWPVAEVLTAAGAALGLAALSAWLPLEAPPFLRSSFALLGRSFVWTAADQVALTGLYGRTAILCLAAGLLPQGRYFLPATLVTLGLVAAALFVRPFLYAAIFMVVLAAVAVFLLADARRPVTLGPLRYLIYTTLALPFFLFAAWLIDLNAAAPENTGLLVQATLLLGAGMAIFFGVVPFHSWLPQVTAYAPPLATALVVVVLRTPVLFLLLRLLAAYDWLGQNPAVYAALTLAGASMVAVGGLLAVGQQNWGRSVGYALLVDFGAVLLAVGTGTAVGVEAALADVTARGVGVWVWALGIDQLRRASPTGEADFESLRGIGWRYPLALTAAALGLLSMMGLPLMAGFPARWALLAVLAAQNPLLAYLLLAAMTSVGVVVMRGLAAMTTPRTPDEAITPQESPLQVAAYGVGIGAILLLGAFPQLLAVSVTDLAAALR